MTFLPPPPALGPLATGLRCLAAAIAAALVPVALADGGQYGQLPPIGSKNVSIADPLVARPSTTPCTVTLFTGLQFADYTPKPIDYTPPAACPAPWSKVVLDVDLAVSAGVQYDRTGTIWLGGLNVWFGTTAEPSPSLAPSWHVERDLTDYSALLASSLSGDVYIGNTVNETYDGVISGSATLEFYPVSAADPAPTVPDQVIPFSAAPGGTTDLNGPTDTLSLTTTLPQNITGAYLDVIAESQYTDEFWWSCLPDSDAAITGDCPGSAFREVEVTLDGTPAGVAPIYPWVFTGGVQPNLWIPTPGVQTLNFVPYRVDLTPFAGVLDDGAEHTIALSVFNAHPYWSTTAALLLYLDPGSATVTGAVASNTLAAPDPQVTGSIGNDGTGTVTVTSNRDYSISGYVDTSTGRVTTTITPSLGFTSTTTYATTSNETIDRTATVTGTTTTAVEGGSTTVSTLDLAYPFSFVYATGPLSIDFDQTYQFGIDEARDGVAAYGSLTSNHVATHYQGAAASRHGDQEYQYTDTNGGCYDRDITSAANALASVTDNALCIPLETIFQDGFDPPPP